MPRWLWWTPLGLLTVGVALMGLRWGWVAATISETDVINRYAERYVQERGGGAAMTDCVAMPGRADQGIWLVVRCAAPDTDSAFEYHVDRFGRLKHPARTGDARAAEPRT